MPDDPGREYGDLETSAEDLYERAPCACLSTLPDGRIVRANTTFFDWLGWSRDAVLGKARFQELLSMGARIYYETHYAPLLEMQGFVNEIALEVRRADGSLRPVVASARQIRDATGEVRVHRVALFDSTDRRRYERELLAARRRAEQAAQQLNEADRQKNEFIALLAHELRNPLAPIRAGVEIFRRSDDKSELLTKTTAMMERQVAQVARLVDDLLDISRIGQNKLSLRRVAVDLRSVVQHAIEMSEPLLQNAGLTFTATVSPTSIHVSADASRLAQAIGNILNNAAKFTPQGGSVSLLVERDGDAAVIRVRDTGIGIDPAELSRVFELFVQAETAHDRPEGLGIGLSLAKSLVERHEGHLTVHSEGRGHGAEFTIRLPALRDVPEPLAPSFPPIERHSQPSPKRILVVDDNQDAAEMMALLLGFGGHDVRVAHDGLAAVALSAELQPDVILLDIGLPKLNGYEAAQRIQEQSGVRPVLVALTGWSQDEDRRKSAAAGFDVHLVKPVDHEELLHLVDGLPSMSSRP